jgi:predicted transglutaminase-like cysteine proteinase
MMVTGCAHYDSASVPPPATPATTEKAIPPLKFGAVAIPPQGHTDFCSRHAAECSQTSIHAYAVRYDSAIKTLEATTFMINHSYEPMLDRDNYKREEYWNYPDNGKADCEDYVLMKRKLLIEKYDFPPSSLLIAFVKDHNNEGHAVLLVRTDRGAYVLDNLTDEVKPWNETGYKFVQATNPLYSRSWVKLTQ